MIFLKKIVSLWLIVLGFSVFFYPTLKDIYTSYNQKQIINDWENNRDSSEQAADSLGHLEDVFSLETAAAGTGGESGETELTAEIPKQIVKKDAKQGKGMVAVIEIDKINLRLPVLNGASMSNLDMGAGLLKGTALPGTSGNSAIAAHRSRAYGKMFNRLNEVSAGDIVKVRDQNQTYNYEVYETLVVKPNAVSVLNSSNDEKTLTLITCTPIDTATHRLIIKAKLP